MSQLPLPMAHHVRGAMFVDSAQMLLDRDLFLPAQWRVTQDDWYPLETFQEVSVAWLHLVAAGNPETFRTLGAKSADRMLAQYPDVVERGDLRETLIRFIVIRQCLYDFTAIEVTGLSDFAMQVKLAFGMQPSAEQAAAFHTAGFITRLLELGGAGDVDVKLLKRCWEGDDETVLEATWRPHFH